MRSVLESRVNWFGLNGQGGAGVRGDGEGRVRQVDMWSCRDKGWMSLAESCVLVVPGCVALHDAGRDIYALGLELELSGSVVLWERTGRMVFLFAWSVL